MTIKLKVSKKQLVLPASACLILLSAIIFGEYFGIIINLSPSMKIGFYQKVKGAIQQGDIVVFCLPEPYKGLGLQRHYLSPGTTCKDSIPLIKQVIAIPGDHVKLMNNSISVNGKNYSYKTLKHDSQGRPLNKYPRGHYQNTTGYWLIGTNSSHSWDSRYWGPIQKSKIISVFKPVLFGENLLTNKTSGHIEQRERT